MRARYCSSSRWGSRGTWLDDEWSARHSIGSLYHSSSGSPGLLSTFFQRWSPCISVSVAKAIVHECAGAYRPSSTDQPSEPQLVPSRYASHLSMFISGDWWCESGRNLASRPRGKNFHLRVTNLGSRPSPWRTCRIVCRSCSTDSDSRCRHCASSPLLALLSMERSIRLLAIRTCFRYSSTFIWCCSSSTSPCTMMPSLTSSRIPSRLAPALSARNSRGRQFLLALTILPSASMARTSRTLPAQPPWESETPCVPPATAPPTVMPA
mmetsp:Transcript_31809/g.101476  ORF Transcript_31809/g.101476 Transcript_31809/m.101476 type:complete len:266 (-) Transcript_31809:522-1319(-)